MSMSQTMICEVRIYVVSRGKNFSIRPYVCTCNSGFEDGERDTCAFITLYTSPRPDFKTLIIIFKLRSIYGFPVPRGNPIIVMSTCLSFFCIFTAHVRMSQRRDVQHDRDPFRLNIRIYGDRGLTLQGRYFIESYIRSSSTRGLGKDAARFHIFIKDN